MILTSEVSQNLLPLYLLMRCLAKAVVGDVTVGFPPNFFCELCKLVEKFVVIHKHFCKAYDCMAILNKTSQS